MEKFIKVCQACHKKDVFVKCRVCEGRQVIELIPATVVGTDEVTYLEIV